MRIGIHTSKDDFSSRWVKYCEDHNISWKPVDCYSNNIIAQLSDCDALMWHINQGNPKDNLFAKQLLYSVEVNGKKAFPNFNTVWHFDDKVGQKYLLESIDAPLAQTYVFYGKREALEWVNTVSYPKVFKLRGGAGSQNVKLVESKREAKRLVLRAFGRGFSSYNPYNRIRETIRKIKSGKNKISELLIALARIFIPPPYAKISGKEKGYIYFQDYIPENTYDIRIIVIGDKAFAIKRLVRENDFRASGSGKILYEKDNFEDSTVRIAFNLAKRLKSQSAAFDFVYSESEVFLLEVSFGFIKEVYDPCTGYWDKNLLWHPGSFNPYGWMVESIMNDL